MTTVFVPVGVTVVVSAIVRMSVIVGVRVPMFMNLGVAAVLVVHSRIMGLPRSPAAGQNQGQWGHWGVPPGSIDPRAYEEQMCIASPELLLSLPASSASSC